MESIITTARNRKKCKKCFHGVLDTRSKRPILVKMILFWLPIKRYRCSHCDKKTYVLGSAWVDVKSNHLQTN
jgi:hypothetical protein